MKICYSKRLENSHLKWVATATINGEEVYSCSTNSFRDSRKAVIENFKIECDEKGFTKLGIVEYFEGVI